jgi:hypothetical protein
MPKSVAPMIELVNNIKVAFLTKEKGGFFCLLQFQLAPEITKPTVFNRSLYLDLVTIIII